MCVHRINIPAIRRRVLHSLRGPIVKEPVVQRYCKLVNRLPPLPQWHIPKVKITQQTDLDMQEQEQDQQVELQVNI